MKNNKAGNKASYCLYTIQSGDSLSKIAEAHGMSLPRLLSTYGNKKFKDNPDLIRSGEKAVVSNVYKIQSGDNLTHVAQTHDMTLQQLLSTYGNEKFKDNPDLIHEGDIVHLIGNF